MPAKKTSGGNSAPEPISHERQVFNQLIQQMVLEAHLESEDAADRHIGVIAAIMDASDDEFWDADDRTSIGGRDLGDVEMDLHAYRVVMTRGAGIPGNPFKDPESGRCMYLELAATRLSDAGELSTRLIAAGEDFTWNTSAPRLVSKIMSMSKRGMLPGAVVVRATDLGDGSAVLKLKPLSARTIIRTQDETLTANAEQPF